MIRMPNSVAGNFAEKSGIHRLSWDRDDLNPFHIFAASAADFPWLT